MDHHEDVLIHVAGGQKKMNRTGSYSVWGHSGTMAAALAAEEEVFLFQWQTGASDPQKFALIDSIVLTGFAGVSTAFVAGKVQIGVRKYTAFTGTTTGGTALTPCKLRTSYNASALVGNGSIRIASTAAIDPVTQTDDEEFTGHTWSVGTAVDTIYQGQVPLWSAHVDGKYSPLILTEDEGFALEATVPADGDWTFGVQVLWSEATEKGF